MAIFREPFHGHDRMPSPQNEVGLYVPAAEVFPGTTADERTLIALLETLDRDDTLFMAARLNIMVTGPGNFEVKPRQQQALLTMVSKESIERVNAFSRRHNAASAPAVFFRGQLLELMRWTARYGKRLRSDGETYTSPENRERFFKAALIASDLWAKRVYGGRLTADTPIEETRLNALGALRKGVEEGNLAPHLGVAIGRGLTFFIDYLPRHLPDFAERFRAATGLTVSQYLSCVAGLCVYIQQQYKDGPLFITETVAAATGFKDVYPVFLALESQSPEELGRSFWQDFDKAGYKVLRERTIMVAAGGRAIVLDPTFFIERISVGALFHAVKGQRRKEALRVFSAFGDAFEEYTADMLRRMYPKCPLLVDRLVFGRNGRDGQGREFQIDAAEFGVAEAVVIETKALFLREEDVMSPDPEVFLAALRKSYGASGDKRERDKGVAQLARSIGAIARGEWNGEKDEFAGLPLIYPVLLVHDTRLDTPALGHFLETEFRALLGPVPAGKRVAPLTIMTVQDLENLETSIGNFSLADLLASYTRECPDRMRSLHNFIVYSEFGQKIQPSEFLKEASLKLHDVLMREFFPKEKPQA
jgi:hypothetical protein